jgi:hypothetical protein
MEVAEGNGEDSPNPTENQQQQAPTSERSRPPPIVLTTETNLIQLQKQVKGIVKGSFEFRSTRNGTRVVVREMADYSTIRSHFESNNLHYYTCHPKSQKPIKAVIRHLPLRTPAEDISDGLDSLGFDVISVKQMSSTRRPSAEGTSLVNLPLFLVTLPRTPKSQEIFKLTGLSHITIKVEAYKARLASRSATTAKSSAMSGLTAGNLPVACGVGAATYTRSAQRRGTTRQNRHAATASWRRVRILIRPIIAAAATRKKSCAGGKSREHPSLQQDGCSPHTPHQMCPTRQHCKIPHSLSHARLQNRPLPEWSNRGCHLQLNRAFNREQVGQFRPLM